MSTLESLEAKRKEAKEIVEQISQQLDKSRNSVEAGLAELRKAQKVNKDFQKLKPSIDRISANANSAISNLRNDRDRVKKLLTTVDNFYRKKYAPLAEKINDPATGLNARIKSGDQFERELKKVRINYEKQIDLIRDLVIESREKHSAIKKIDKSINDINTKILKYDASISDKKVKIEEAGTIVASATKKIADSEKVILEKEEKILEIHEKSETTFKEIVDREIEANEILNKIQTIYEIAAETGLGGEFDKRRKILDLEQKKWQKHLFLTTLILFGAIIIIYVVQLFPVGFDLTKLKLDVNFYVRFLITSPIIYYLVFVTNQFNRTKSLLEKYSFKTALSLSIDAHINLLTGVDKFQDKEIMDRVANFILEGFNTIYREPYQKVEAEKSKDIQKEILNLLKKEKTNSPQSSSSILSKRWV